MFAILFCLCAQEAPADPRKMLYAYLEKECAKKFDERRKVIAALRTPEDVKRRQEELRAKFIDALGGFPERTPLNARVTGKESRDGFHVEKVIYESRPDHHVTATLYLPDGKGPFPAVLVPCGHWNQAKAADDYQHMCMLLAKNGIGSLCFDPFGQGERLQLLTPEGKPSVGYGTFEHTLASVGSMLTGGCTAQFHVWDGIRSLDYLASRPEIDPKRLGCTGNSGGGTQTAYLMALDERIQCAVPNCFITSLERLFGTIGPQDGEQNIPGQVAFGMEHADYLLLRAPRPTQISCTTHDFFDVGGAWTTFREAKQVYAILGHGERVDLFEYNEPHSFSKPIRQAAAGWFNRWLTGVDQVPVEADLPAFKEAELYCTPSGNVIRDLKGKTVFDLTAEREKALAAGRGKLSKEALLKEVRRLIALPDSVPPAKVGDAFETEPGIKVPALRIAAKDGPLTLYVNGEGKAKAAGREGLVLAIDVRGMGETQPDGKRIGWERWLNSDWRESFLGVHLNRPLLGQRVYDVLSVVGTLDPSKAVHAIGVGAGAPIVLHAAALDVRIGEVTLEGGVISWSVVARTAVTINQLTNVVPGALKVYDLPDLAAALAPRPLTIVNAVDAAGRPVTQAELEEAYAGARAAYKAAGAPEKLVLKAGP
jgi:dienelactone hydrolase/pimeloyl-ACP methyl ester carboxylesterase